ncbi:MAG: zinc ribbon domain-containing protein [Nitrospinota bacterium]|nr:zinc ribbon domain-containing protein [Nitrospinota bacterium]
MECPDCGANLNDGASVCTECGIVLKDFDKDHKINLMSNIDKQTFKNLHDKEGSMFSPGFIVIGIILTIISYYAMTKENPVKGMVMGPQLYRDPTPEEKWDMQISKRERLKKEKDEKEKALKPKESR